MLQTHPDYLKSERSTEIPFFVEQIAKLTPESRALEIGGIPSHPSFYEPVYRKLDEVQPQWEICDYRGGKWQGNFMLLDFGENKYDFIASISTIEHSNRCSEEEPPIYREDEDIKVFAKALSLLKKDGKMVVTVPFGKDAWYGFHQSYNFSHIQRLSVGAKIDEMLIYQLEGDNWNLVDYSETVNTENEGPVRSVGLFVFSHAD